jgi:DNA-binding response OmpR family regulator
VAVLLVQILRVLVGGLLCPKSRDDLLNHIWGTDVYVLARTVDVHIRRVREKIGENYIKTVKGVGYKFDPEELE